jgi:glycosyltransferase involved in cell wall biosynthesis
LELTIMPKVTVITAVKDGEAYIGRTVESILSQSFGDLRYLVVNDGSRDRTGEILGSFHDPRLEVIDLPQSVGVAEARNAALDRTDSPLVALSDADDVSLPHRLAAQVQALEARPELVLAGSAYEIIDGRGRAVGRHRPPTDPTRIRFYMLLTNCFAHSSAMFRLEAAHRCGLRYDSRLPPSEDYDFFSRLVEAGPATNLAEPLIQYREHGGQASSLRRGVQERNALTINRQNLARLGFVLDDGELEALLSVFHDRPASEGERRRAGVLLLKVLAELRRRPGLDHEVLTDLQRIWALRLLSGRGWSPRGLATLAAAAPGPAAYAMHRKILGRRAPGKA